MKKKLIISVVVSALCLASVLTPALAEQHCVVGSSACSADLDSVIIAAKGLADMKWVSSMVKQNKSYICRVVYLNSANSGFIAKTGTYGTMTREMPLTKTGDTFSVRSNQSGVIGFLCDGTNATGPGDPQITLKCTSYTP